MIIVIIFLLVIIAILSLLLSKTRRKLAAVYRCYLYRGYPKPWPVKRVSVTEVAPFFAQANDKDKLAAEIHMICGEFDAGITDREKWILLLLAKHSKKIFEFGTCTGGTTYLLARNCPEDGQVVTLTLHPDQLNEVEAAQEDDVKGMNIALSESRYTKFVYQKTSVESKITQLFSDSKKLDETPYIEQFDMIFIDGAHVYSYVMSDTEKALKMLKPGGIALWHDYRGPTRAEDVFKALNKLSKKMPLAHIEGTALVFYRKPTISTR